MDLKIKPTLEEIYALNMGSCDIVPVFAKVYADCETPISLYKRFEKGSSCSFLLDSVETDKKWARYSFIGRNPIVTLRSYGQGSIIDYRADQHKPKIISDKNPVEALKDLMEGYKGVSIEGVPPLFGGAVGYFGYDTIRYFERLENSPKKDGLDLPECFLMIVDEMIVFDHQEQKISLIVNMHAKGSIEENYKKACRRINELYKMLFAPLPLRQEPPESEDNEVTSNLTKEQYFSMVERAKKYIVDGDIFQVVLSQRFSIKVTSPFDCYRTLRVSNPSPYMYYLKMEDFYIVGASPEKLLRYDGKTLENSPIAGTRKRGLTQKEDEELEKELLADEKELAEHNMLLDLGRNDLGRVSRFGTVKMPEIRKIVRFSKVMHIYSTVTGELDEKYTPYDALMSVFPAGTLSGAPKIRAMEIIDELEPCRRGVYGGVICYISFDGTMDSCIAIRTIVIKDGRAYVQAGGGIVFDSDPQKEFDESVNKAKAALNAVKEAREIQ